ncbi:unnamed protein product, partial [Callosobruchus maculatus]
MQSFRACASQLCMLYESRLSVLWYNCQVACCRFVICQVRFPHRPSTVV